MTDKEYWQGFNPRKWDKETLICGVYVIAAIAMFYIAISVFY